MLIDHRMELLKEEELLDTFYGPVVEDLIRNLPRTRLEGKMLKQMNSAFLDVKHQVLKCLNWKDFLSEDTVGPKNIEQCLQSFIIAKSLRRKLADRASQNIMTGSALTTILAPASAGAPFLAPPPTRSPRSIAISPALAPAFAHAHAHAPARARARVRAGSHASASARPSARVPAPAPAPSSASAHTPFLYANPLHSHSPSDAPTPAYATTSAPTSTHIPRPSILTPAPTSTPSHTLTPTLTFSPSNFTLLTADPTTSSPSYDSISPIMAEANLYDTLNSSFNFSPGNSQDPRQESPTLSNGHFLSVVRKVMPDANSSTPQGGETNHKKSVIVTAVLSVGGTSFFMIFIFSCYKKCSVKKKYSFCVKNENPMLNLGSSNVSGSSDKTLEPTLSKDNHENESSEDENPTLNLGSSNISGSSDKTLEPTLSKDNHENESSEAGSLKYTLSARINSNGLPLPPGMHPPLDLPPTSPSSPTAMSLLPLPHAPPMPPPLPIIHPIKKGASSPSRPLPAPNENPHPQPPPPPNAGLRRQFHPPPQGPDCQFPGAHGDDSAHKTKLKPFFWDKVNTNPNHSMIWHHIGAGSFQFNEEMIETLFSYNSSGKTNGEGKKQFPASDSAVQYVQFLDPKKSQNLAISLKAFNLKTQEVCKALVEGNELPVELLETLLRMQPTMDEEQKLRLYSDDISLLGPAEQFLKILDCIPFAFKRMDVLLFMSTLHEDISSLKDSFATIEAASTEIGSSRLFSKLLEAVLKTGNRMNDGTYRGGARAFKLDTLLKLSDVKGSDGKTTLLHFVVLEIMHSEGARVARLENESESTSSLMNYNFSFDNSPEGSPKELEDHLYKLGLNIVSGLSSELENVKKSASLDFNDLTNTVMCFNNKIEDIKTFLNTDMQTLGEESGFYESLKCFVEHAEAAIASLLTEENKIKSLVQQTNDYFYGNARKNEGLQLFVVVRDFLGMLDNVCKEINDSPNKLAMMTKQ